jgi:hypothetical protein
MKRDQGGDGPMWRVEAHGRRSGLCSSRYDRLPASLDRDSASTARRCETGLSTRTGPSRFVSSSVIHGRMGAMNRSPPCATCPWLLAANPSHLSDLGLVVARRLAQAVGGLRCEPAPWRAPAQLRSASRPTKPPIARQPLPRCTISSTVSTTGSTDRARAHHRHLDQYSTRSYFIHLH